MDCHLDFVVLHIDCVRQVRLSVSFGIALYLMPRSSDTFNKDLEKVDAIKRIIFAAVENFSVIQ